MLDRGLRKLSDVKYNTARLGYRLSGICVARSRRAEEEMEDLSCDTSKRTNTAELQSPVCEVTTVQS